MHGSSTKSGSEGVNIEGMGLFSHVLYGYWSIPINTIFRGMNIHLPAILMFTRGTRFWHTAISHPQFIDVSFVHATYFVLAVEGVPSGHHGNGKIHAWCLIAGGYMQIVSSLFSRMENRPGRGNFIPKQPSFTSQWLCRSQSKWHWQPIPQPKPQDWILWPFHVIRFFSACVANRPGPCPQVLLRIFHVWGCESAALTPPRKGANGGRAVPSLSRNGVYPMYPFYMCPAKSATCVAEIRDVAADSGCCLSFQKVSSPSDSKNDLPVHPDVSESSDKSTIPHHSSGSLMNPFNFGDGKDILQRSVVISDSLHSGLDV